MRTTLDIPDEVADEVRRRAELGGHGLVEQIVQLVRLGLLVSDVPADIDHILRFVQVARNAVVHDRSFPRTDSALTKDESTGLPVIHSPAEAPIHTMNADEVLALTQNALVGEDIERAGFTI